MKRLFDVALSIVLIILLLPIFILLSILIILESRGDVLFKQKRLGKSGKVFEIYKFRTMIPNAESIGAGIFTHDKDPRITKVGSFLRKTSLDELPQIFNVFRGEMSFVGPRPPVPYHPRKYEEYNEIQRKRFDVKPGITGLAQVTGRNHLSWDERIVADVEYVNTMSFWLDMTILYKTFMLIIKREDVYRKEK